MYLLPTVHPGTPQKVTNVSILSSDKQRRRLSRILLLLPPPLNIVLFYHSGAVSDLDTLQSRPDNKDADPVHRDIARHHHPREIRRMCG